jgi:dihydrofolate reductase
MDVDYKILVAYEKNRGIGYKGDLPWYLPEDLKRFKALTKGQTCVMGATTFNSVLKQLGKPLQGRTSIVLSRKMKKIDYDNCQLFHSVEDILKNIPKAWILGGTHIYQEFLPYVNEICATEIDMGYTCDAFFPEINMEEWQVKNIEQKDGFRFVDYIRI